MIDDHKRLFTRSKTSNYPIDGPIHLGLGHMAVKLAVAMGAEVTVITTSAEKRDAAIT